MWTTEWTVSVTVKRFLIPGDYTVLFFLEQPDLEALTNVVGSFTSFKASTQFCVNCASQNERDEFINGGANITRELAKKVRNVTDHAAVEAFLKDNLEWRVVDVS